MRALPSLTALVALALLAPAAAQVTTTSSLEVEVGAGSPVTIPLGSGNATTVTVTLTLNGLACTGPGTATVALTVDGAISGVTPTIDPAQLTFDGINGNLRPYSQDQTATLNVTLDPGFQPDHQHELNVTATFNGQVTNCQALPPASGIPPATASDTHQVVSGPAQNTTTEPEVDGGGDNGSPGLGFTAAIVLVAVAVALRRRK
jgi:hypothetical protein